jgi:FAD dependent oxidoreductase
MIIEQGVQERQLRTISHNADLAVVGGGISGLCASIAAARLGSRVVLVHDRPVLGGNASSEVRLWILGATSHMGNNNRWAREGGIMEEILVENLYRNPEGNPLIFDTILLEKICLETNITLLLNTAVFEVSKRDDQTIESVTAYCSQNQTMYLVHAPLFVDASGDGIVGFLAGAAFRMGAEPASEFNEKFAPSKEYGELLGQRIRENLFNIKLLPMRSKTLQVSPAINSSIQRILDAGFGGSNTGADWILFWKQRP